MKRLTSMLLAAFLSSAMFAAQAGGLGNGTDGTGPGSIVDASPITGPAAFVDMKIASEGYSNVLVTPSTPFAMVKPAPDCGRDHSSGWMPVNDAVDGFSQVHLGGTGGCPKYGNILLQPFTGDLAVTHHRFTREWEQTAFSTYSTQFAENGIKTEFTSADRSSFFRFTYPDAADKALGIDAGWFLGPISWAGEQQMLVGAEIQTISDREISGYTRVRGGWNKGRAYTVYFYLVSDTPFEQVVSWKGDTVSEQTFQPDCSEPVGLNVRFAGSGNCVNIKLGISGRGCLKARQNALEEIPHWQLEQTASELVAKWNDVFNIVELDPDTPLKLKRIFYTALFRIWQNPVNKSGECPLWSGDEPYYDDFYALWDTFRTSWPLFSLMKPSLASNLANGLLTIYKYDKYLPDGRSGNCNGRTQGGSNADIILAEYYLKGIEGVDWNLALEAVLKDATVPPGDNEEMHGRGGLVQYNSLGYLPYGTPLAGSRTVDYSYCDFAIYTLAKGLGRDDVAERFLRQSSNWKNLWRPDMESQGVKGFIMPRAASGEWLDSRTDHAPGLPDLVFTPEMATRPEYPDYTTNWDCFFYEASSWVYSLSVPHDVPGLIDICGGPEQFEKRLDTFFDNGHFAISNEPSFIDPYLYHWLGKPWRSSERVRETLFRNFSDGEHGLPGNDDTGAMSAWLAFNLMGFYPVAGTDCYLLVSPLVEGTTFHLENGKDFVFKAEKLSDKNIYIQKARLNGKPYPYAALRHEDIMAGGSLVLTMGPKPSEWGSELPDFLYFSTFKSNQ